MDGHISLMRKPSNRDKILTQGLRVVHERGFGGASVRDIVQAAGVPQGSFTNHFASKEAFGLEILELYFANNRRAIDETLGNETLQPLQRLRAYFDVSKTYFAPEAIRNGCLLGNLSAETSEHSELIRQRLTEIFAEVEQSVADCLRAAVKAGEVSADIDCDEVAGFIVASLQGATLLAKAQRSLVPLQRLEHVLFSMILR